MKVLTRKQMKVKKVYNFNTSFPKRCFPSYYFWLFQLRVVECMYLERSKLILHRIDTLPANIHLCKSKTYKTAYYEYAFAVLFMPRKNEGDLSADYNHSYSDIVSHSCFQTANVFFCVLHYLCMA